MRIAWSDKDIEVGMKVAKVGDVEEYIIGFMMDQKNRKVCRISLSDGMSIGPISRSEMAAELTAEEFFPSKLLRRDSQGAFRLSLRHD